MEQKKKINIFKYIIMIKDLRVVVQLSTANFCPSIEGMGKLHV